MVRLQNWNYNGLYNLVESKEFEIIARQVILTVLEEDFLKRNVKRRHVILLMSLIYYVAEKCLLEDLNYMSLYKLLREYEKGFIGEDVNVTEMILNDLKTENPNSFSLQCFERFKDKYSDNEQWVCACHCLSMCEKALNKNSRFLGLITNDSDSLVNQEYFKKIIRGALSITGLPFWKEFENESKKSFMV